MSKMLLPGPCALRRFVLSTVLLSTGMMCSRGVAQDAQPPTAPESTPPAVEPPAAAEDKPYQVLPVDEKQLRSAGTRVTQIRLAGKFANDQEIAIFDLFYKKYDLARWTQPKNYDQLPAFRQSLINNLRTCGTGGRPPVVHDHLNTLVLEYMEAMATRHFHPAVRVNAMLMVGELNAKESAVAAVPPHPLAEALKAMVGAVRDPKQLDAVKVAALVGIARHARLGAIATPADQKLAVDAALELLGARRPAGRSAEGDAWMRAQAAGVLGLLKTPGANNAVIAALQAMVANQGLPLSARCAAAEALGGINFRSAGATDVAPIATALGRLAADACAAEAGSISRRRLKARLNAVNLGLAAIANAGSTPEAVARVRNSVGAILTLIEDRQLGDEPLIEKINEEAKKFQAAAPPKSP